MLSFKGGFKYTALLMVAGWMFFLGILVGRGTSPVTFDTQSFQERLAIIVQKSRDMYPEQKKVELDFYKSLNEPVVVEKNITDKKPKDVVVSKVAVNQESMTREEAVTDIPAKTVDKEEINKEITVKTSLKHMTAVKTKSETIVSQNAVVTSTEKQAAAEKKEDEPRPYTVQVASYPNFQDALAHISALEKKGFTAYRTMWKNNDQIWYRVRTGSFSSKKDAEKYLDTLKVSDIKGMIIKRTDDENIQE